MFFFGLILVFFYFLRLWLSAFAGIHPDEAYYWVGSLHPALGYYDYPPLIAYLIGVGRFFVQHLVPQSLRESSPEFWGQIELRIVPYFFSSVLTPLAVGKIIENLQRKPLFILQMGVLLTSPLFFLGPQIISPDIPFYFAWSVALLLGISLLRFRKSEDFQGDATPFQPALAALLGLVLAFAVYSKYLGFLLVILVILTGSGVMNFLLAGTVCFILLIPHFFWMRDKALPYEAIFYFPFKQPGLVIAGNAPQYKNIFILFLSQFVFWNPLIFLLSLWLPFLDVRHYFSSLKRSPLTGILVLWAFAPLVFFAVLSTQHSIPLHWPLVGFIGALILVLSRLVHRPSLHLLMIAIHISLIVFGGTLVVKGERFAAIGEKIAGSSLGDFLRRPSRLSEFSDWGRFHSLVFEAVRSEGYPIEVEGYEVLSELLFFDTYNANGEQLGTRLKILPELSPLSEFHFNQNYLPLRPAQRRWILVRQKTTNLPADCKSYQSFFKDLEQQSLFRILRCGF